MRFSCCTFSIPPYIEGNRALGSLHLSVLDVTWNTASVPDALDGLVHFNGSEVGFIALLPIQPAARDTVLIPILSSQSQFRQYLTDLQTLDIRIQDARDKNVVWTVSVEVAGLEIGEKSDSTYPIIATDGRSVGIIRIMLFADFSEDGKAYLVGSDAMMKNCANQMPKFESIGPGQVPEVDSQRREDYNIEEFADNLEKNGGDGQNAGDLKGSDFELFTLLDAVLQRCDNATLGQAWVLQNLPQLAL
jgi:hypothetical protein